MDREKAIDAVVELLRSQGKATNAQMLRMCEDDEVLLREVRESLILDDVAEDKHGVGLVLRGFASASTATPPAERVKLFLSYGRRDAKELADRLAADLRARGFDVWLDTREIATGTSWQHEIADGLRSAQVVVALLSPHSVRTSEAGQDGVDSVCLGEIAYALFQPPQKPVLPVMAAPCEPPLAIFHLDYVDLTRWRDSEAQYAEGLARLLDGIDAARQGKKRLRTWHRQLQPWDFAAFLHEKRRDFTGRQWLFDEIDAWRASAANERALLVTGDPGTGKSAMVAELVHRNPAGQVIAYHCCQADTPATLEPWRFVRSVAAMIASRLPEYEARLSDPAVQEMLEEETCRSDPAGALERAVFAPLETVAAPADGVRYLLVDALDEALTLGSGLTIVQLLASRIHRLPAWLRVLATTRKEPEVLNRLRGLRAQELDAQDERNLDDVGVYLRKRLAGPNIAAAVAASGRSAAEVLDSLAKRSAGNFLYARQALDGLDAGLYSVEELDSLPSGLYSLYDANFRRQFGQRGEGFSQAKSVLEAVVAAQEPLTHEELAEVVGLDPRRDLPGVMNRLAAFVPGRRDVAGVLRYAAFHKSLADWLTAEDLLGATFSVLPEDGHRLLAATATKQHRLGAKAMSAYSLRHAARHLIAAGCWDDLEILLTDLAYLERRNETGQLVALAHDFDAAYAALPAQRPLRKPIRLLGEALRRDLHFIARHAADYPQGLFQSLWNGGWWYDSPAADIHYEAPEAIPWEPAPWEREGPKLFELLDRWRTRKEQETPGFVWLRALRPPRIPLGSGLRATLAHDYTPTQAVFSPDGNRVLSVSPDPAKTWRMEIATEWDVETGIELRRFEAEGSSVACATYHPDGRQIVYGLADGDVVVCDRITGMERFRFRASGVPAGLACSRDGALLAVWSASIEIWSLDSGMRASESELSAAIPPGKSNVSCPVTVHFSATADELFVYGYYGDVRIWRWRSGEVRGFEDSSRTLVDASPSGRSAWRVNWERFVVCDEDGQAISELDPPASRAVLSNDGSRLAFFDSNSRMVRVWDVRTRRQIYCVDTCIDLSCVAFSPDGRMLLTGGSREDTGGFEAGIGRPFQVLVWDLDSEVFSRRLFTHSSGSSRTDAFDDVAFVRAADRVITSNGRTFQIWDARDGSVRVRRSFEPHVFITEVPGRPEFIGGSWLEEAAVIDARTGESLRTLPCVQSRCRFVGNGRFAVFNRDRGVRAWDTTRWEEVCPEPGDCELRDEFLVLRDWNDGIPCILRFYRADTMELLHSIEPEVAFPSEPSDDRFRATGENGEWIVVRTADETPVARIPSGAGVKAFDDSMRLLAAASFDHLALYRLEGDLDPG